MIRPVCGSGAGTRLAVIDNDGRDLDKVELDAEVLINVDAVPRASAHAALLIGWAIGARTAAGGRFRGVAPDASVRFYCIPKAADEVVSLPLAIVRAVDDGADIIVCSTYIEGQTSPLLDDALGFARALGRGAKGTVVIFPTGREMSSPPGSIHSSLSLGMSEPASDPRAFCVGPSSRDGTWFLWRDRHGKLRPFANRGPSLRWVAPGDDMANPFSADDRPSHAESSGAAGIASGVIALLLECNPDLTAIEIETLLSETLTPVDPAAHGADDQLADSRDLLPLSADADGHNAKHGYGRLNAAAACASARDPIAYGLTRIGEFRAALEYIELRSSGAIPCPYSDALGQWMARALLSDCHLKHALSSLLRAYRLIVVEERTKGNVPGQFLRHLGTIIRRLIDKASVHDAALRELTDLDTSLVESYEQATELESAIFAELRRAFAWAGDATRDGAERWLTTAEHQRPGRAAQRPPMLRSGS